MKHDVADYRIIVLLNEEYHEVPTLIRPLEAEGIVLRIFTLTDYALHLFNNGGILELLCNPEIEADNGYAVVRWPNDRRGIVSFGELVFRRGNVSRCNSIWEEAKSNINISETPIEELNPNYGGYSVERRIEKLLRDNIKLQTSLSNINYYPKVDNRGISLEEAQRKRLKAKKEDISTVYHKNLNNYYYSMGTKTGRAKVNPSAKIEQMPRTRPRDLPEDFIGEIMEGVLESTSSNISFCNNYNTNFTNDGNVITVNTITTENPWITIPDWAAESDN